MRLLSQFTGCHLFEHGQSVSAPVHFAAATLSALLSLSLCLSLSPLPFLSTLNSLLSSLQRLCSAYSLVNTNFPASSITTPTLIAASQHAPLSQSLQHKASLNLCVASATLLSFLAPNLPSRSLLHRSICPTDLLAAPSGISLSHLTSSSPFHPIRPLCVYLHHRRAHNVGFDISTGSQVAS